jgi:hypothetical protein
MTACPLFTGNPIAASQPDSTQMNDDQRTCVHARSHLTQWRSSEHTALTSLWLMLCLTPELFFYHRLHPKTPTPLTKTTPYGSPQERSSIYYSMSSR